MRRPGYLVLLFLIGCGEAGTKTPSGLRYQDLTEGTGATAQPKDFVQVHYTGTLTDGKEFDSSKRSGAPFTFRLGDGDVIRGWDEGVAGMKVGGKRKLWIPPALAYGARGQPPDIPPDAELIFEVELLKIIPLKIEDKAEGAGEPAKAGDMVEVHYTGTLSDGTVFDTSRKRDEPIRFMLGVGKVIPGWDKGLLGMKPGGKRKLTIPAELAYGARGRPPVIPPNAELTFEVELMRVLRK
jgi:FKBP-type peptidyl-prolyl cis-trans isomerase